MLRKNKTRLSLILLVGLMSISMGCALSQKQYRNLIPAKPQLPSLTQNDRGGISLDAADSKKLAEYIQALERAVRH